MKKRFIFLLLIMLLIVGCSKNGLSEEKVISKDISLNDMKSANTSYLQVNDKTLAFPFTLNDFFEAFPEYDAYVSFDGVSALFGGFGKMDLNQNLAYGSYIELKIIKKLGEEDDQTKLKNSRFYLKAFVTSNNGDTLGNSVVFAASYQYTKYYDFGLVKLNGIEINKTTVGEVEDFFKETYGDYRVSDGAISCDESLTSKKFKGIEYLGTIRYPNIYVSIPGYSKNFQGSEIINYVSVTYRKY